MTTRGRSASRSRTSSAARLQELELESWVKTSGSTGIHVIVPIVRRSTWDDTYEFAERVARGLEDEHPGRSRRSG